MGSLTLDRSAAPRVTIAGREVIAFAGCDYLGLAHAPEVREALREGVERYGVSASASRATTGNMRAHEDLERDLARFLGLEAALLVPDGYLSNHVLLQGIAHHRPLAIVDAEAHVSTRDALAANGIATRDYATCDAAAASMARGQHADHVALVTDGAYPVLRRIAPLPQLLEIVPADGWLVVDDCHGTGVLGARGRGTHEHHGIVDRRLVVTGTLSKALGCFGGFVAGTRALVTEVAERSRAFAGSTPIPPALAVAGSTAIRLLEADTIRLRRLRENIDRVRQLLRAVKIDTHELPLPVFAWKAARPDVGDRIHAALLEHGVLIPHVRYPDGLGSYFRLAVSAAHDEQSLTELGEALSRVWSP